MTADATTTLWLLPLATAVLMGLIAWGPVRAGRNSRTKVAFCFLASSLIITLSTLTPIALSLGHVFWAKMSLGTWCVIVGLSWPFYSLWVLPDSLPKPNTLLELRCQAVFLWVFAISGVCFASFLAIVCLR